MLGGCYKTRVAYAGTRTVGQFQILPKNIRYEIDEDINLKISVYFYHNCLC